MGALDDLAGQPAQPQAGSALDALTAPPPVQARPQVRSALDQLSGSVPADDPSPALSGMLADRVAKDPSLQTATDELPMLTRFGNYASKYYKDLAKPSILPFGWDQLGDAPASFAREWLNVGKFPGTVAESIQKLNPEKYGDFLPFKFLSGQKKMIDWFDQTFLPEQKEEPWYESIDNALGSAGAYMLGGGTAAIGRAGASLFGRAIPYMAGAGMGAATGGVNQYEEAIAMGADPKKAALALAGGMAVGTTDAVGGLFVNKLSKLGGNRMEQIIKLYNRSKEKSVPLESLIGGITEFAQEGFESAAGDWVAKDLAGYDPTREIGQNFWDNAFTGGATGSILGAGIGKLRSQARADVYRKIEDFKKAQEALNAPINQLAGQFLPIGDYTKISSMFNELTEKLSAEQAVAGEALRTELGTDDAEEALYSPAPAHAGMIPAEDAAPNRVRGIGMEAGSEYDYLSQLMEDEVDTSVEKALGKKPDGTNWTTREALLKQPVVARNFNPYSKTLELTKQALTTVEQQIKDYAKSNNMTYADVLKKPEFQAVSEALTKLQDNEIALRSKVAIADRLLGVAKGYISAFRKVYGPDFKMLVTNVDPTQSQDPPGGSMIVTNDVELAPGVKSAVGHLFINVDKIATDMYNNRGKATTAEIQADKRTMFDTLNHELGHAVTSTTLNKLYNEAMNGKTPEARKKAYDTFAWLKQDYQRWLNEASTSPQRFIANTLFSGQRTLSDAQGLLNNKPLKTGDEEFDSTFPGGGATKAYFMSFDEYFAEMTARLGSQGKFEDESMTNFFRSARESYKELFKQIPWAAQQKHGNNWERFLESRKLEYKLKEKLEELSSGQSRTLLDAIKGLLPDYDPKAFVGLDQHLDRWSKGMSYALNLIQMVKENPHISHWRHYLEAVTLWQNYQRNFGADAVGILKDWKALAKGGASKVGEILFDEATQKRNFTPAELATKLNAEEIAVYAKIRKQLNTVLSEMQVASLKDAEASFDGEDLKKEVDEINKEFASFKERGYFPFMRYGNFTIQATANQPLVYNGRQFKKGQLITFPVFENQKQRDDMVEKLKAEFGTTANVGASKMRETDNVIQGMPRSLLRSLRNKMEAAGGFTPDHARAFNEALQENSPFRNFRKQFVKKRYIFGYSEDAMRSFATYMQSAAGHIARVKFADMMREPIAGMQQDVDIILATGGRAQERQEMRHWLDRHFKYIMNPDNDLAGLRSVGFVAFLGFGVKAAAVNLTQVMTTTAPYLAARYGDLKTIAALSKATWTFKDWVANKKDYVDALPDENGVIKRPNDRKNRHGRMMAQGLHEGWIDQSLATELAIARSESNLDSSLYLPTGRRAWHTFARLSAAPFHLVEKTNRVLTAFAAYDLEYAKSKNHEKAVNAAKQANWSTHYENARWNRPEFMRGKKGAALLFKNYVQNTMYFATRDPGAVRWWMGMLLLAGAMGMPGAEDMEDIIDYVVTHMNEVFGKKNPKFALRQEMREQIEHLGLNPDIILHGLSQSSFGWGHVGELTGMPIPRFDLSQSFSMGNIVPFTEIPGQLQAGQDPYRVATEGVAAAGGALGNLALQFYEGLTSRDPNEWKRVEKLMPVMSFQDMIKTGRLVKEGGEFTQAGDPVATFDPHDIRDNIELAGRAFGFTPTKISRGWERTIAVKDMAAYYDRRRGDLMKQYDYAVYTEDRESEAKMMKEIRLYNDTVPYPEMGIAGPDLKQSASMYVKSKYVAGMGIEADKKYYRLKKKTEASYPDPAGKILKEPGTEATP